MSILKTIATKFSSVFIDTYYDEEDNVTGQIDTLGEIPHGLLKTKRLTNYTSIREVSKEYSPILALLGKMAAMSLNGKLVVESTSSSVSQSKIKGWTDLLDQPNPHQTKAEFFAQLEIFTRLAGFCFVKPVYPLGYGNDRPSQLWIIPPQFIKVEPVRVANPFTSDPTKMRRVWFVYGGQRKLLDESKLLLFKDNSATDISDSTGLPLSRLSNLEYPITTGIGTYESMRAMTYDRGANGILSNQTTDIHGHIDVDPDEQENILKHYRRTYGLTNDKISRIIMSSANLKWQPMTFNVQELMLHEQHASCIKDICASFFFPHRLLTISEGATYNNQNEDKQTAYVDCIIPNMEAIIQQLNKGLRTAEDKVIIKVSFSHIPVLQRSELDKGRGRTAQNNAYEKQWLNGNCTRNEWRVALGDKPIDRPEFDKFIFELTEQELTNMNVGTGRRNAQDNPAADSNQQGTEPDNPNDNGK